MPAVFSGYVTRAAADIHANISIPACDIRIFPAAHMDTAGLSLTGNARRWVNASAPQISALSKLMLRQVSVVISPVLMSSLICRSCHTCTDICNSKKATGNLSAKDSFTLAQNFSIIEHFVTRIEPRIENGYAIIENCTDKLVLKTVHSPVIHSELFVPHGQTNEESLRLIDYCINAAAGEIIFQLNAVLE